MRDPPEKHLKPSQLDALKLLRRVGGITVVEAAQLGVLDLKKRVSELINDHAYIVDKRFEIHYDHKGRAHRGCKRYTYLGWSNESEAA